VDTCLTPSGRQFDCKRGKKIGLKSCQRSEIPFAIDAAGHVVSVAYVERGLACNCTCPGCGGRVVAKKGEVVTWHFAHADVEACQAGYESAIHLAVKQIIENRRALLLPPCNVFRHPDGDCATIAKMRFRKEKTHHFGDFEYVPWTPSETDAAYPASGYAVLPGRLVKFDEVIVERQEGDIRPDLIGVLAGRRLYIEVAVTHFIDNEKERRIRARDIPTIEIAVEPLDHGYWTLEMLEARMLEGSSGKAWIFNPKAEAIAQQSHIARKMEADAKEAARRQEYEKQREIYDREREERARVKRLRKEAFEKHYKPLLEAEFRPYRQGVSTIVVKFCPSNVSIKVHRRFSQPLAEIVGLLAKQFGGIYNAGQYQWEMPPNEDLFFTLANALKDRGDLLLDSLDAPDQVKRDAVLERLGLSIPWRKSL